MRGFYESNFCCALVSKGLIFRNVFVRCLLANYGFVHIDCNQVEFHINLT